MNIKNIFFNKKKLLSLFFVFYLLGFPTKGKAEKMYFLENNNLVFTYGENNNPDYKRYNEETKEYSDISIFDKENTLSIQYGANQKDFKGYFDKLISDPIIWEELQSYYPVNDFQDEGEAMLFYEKLFEMINDTGCGYVAAANHVFKLFEGCEEEFEKHFGYSMYKVDEKGNIDFNYEIFITKFFLYSITKNGFTKVDIINSIAYDIVNYRIGEYIKSEEYNCKRPENYSDLSDEERNTWNAFEEERTAYFKKLYYQWQHFKNTPLDLGIEVDETFGFLKDYLKKYGINVDIKVYDYNFKCEVGDILASDGFSLCKENEKIDYSKTYGAHYVYVTEITDDGKIIVSSWGKKYVFDDSEADWTSKVFIKFNGLN